MSGRGRRLLALGGVAGCLAGCSASGTTRPAPATPAVASATGAQAVAPAGRTPDSGAGAATAASASGLRARAAATAAAAAAVDGDTVTLSNGLVRRAWRVDHGSLGGYVTTALDDPVRGRRWAVATSPDFSLAVDGVTLTSASGWGAVAVSTERGADGASVTFALQTPAAAPAIITVRRTYTLHDASPTVRVSTRVSNGGALPLRLGPWTLDELTSPVAAGAEVDAYRAGSDFTTSFHTTATASGSFDDEGEVLRADAGDGSGWFLVGARRGGALSRAGAALTGGGWRTYVGVDPARDLLDAGPETVPGSDDNRVTNPAYPAPVRERTLEPLAAMDLGVAYTGVYAGGRQQAAAALAAEMDVHDVPAARSVDLNTFHPWGHGPGLSDATLRPQAALARSLGVETFMLDDQWQGSSAGDWTWDTARFPLDGHGVPLFVDYLHSLGLNLGLWMSPMEFNPSSATYAAHPDWACAPTGDVTAQLPDASGLGVWDATNPALLAHLSAVVDHAISAWGVTEFKFDYLTWVDCPPHDYLDYEDAFTAWVRSLEQAHPGVAFEIDETNDQRTWPFESVSLGTSWFDNDHTTTPVQKQLHDVWSAAPWLPPSTLGVGLYDGTLAPPYSVDFLMPLALLTHVTFWTDLTTLSTADRDETAWWLSWYSVHRADLAGLVYNLTPGADPLDGSSWAAFEPWSSSHGYVVAFRQSSSQSTLTVPLQGLDAATAYTVTDVRTGGVLLTASGAQLAAGLTVALAQPWSAEVLAVSPA